ncbi:MAG TPA: HK97 family phage prohead protease [Terracidiphilus sp.]|jgi:hypothetical protein|nr:HK97 family phage prohead protease [Terracidiphilus sp.]
MTVRTLADGSKQIGGYAIVFNSRSVDLGGFTEIVSPGAVKRTLKDGHPILALRDHKQELLLGNTAAGTLELKADSKGLAFTITLPRTAIGEDTAENVRLRNLFGVSFGFSVNYSEDAEGDSWAADADGNVVRTLLDIDLFEVSPTSFAAYPEASVSTRSASPDIRAKLKAKRADPGYVQGLDMLGILNTPDDTDLDNTDGDSEDTDGEEQCSCMRSAASCVACRTGDHANCNAETRCDFADRDADQQRSDSLRMKTLIARRMAV